MKLEYMFQISWPPEGKESHRVLVEHVKPQKGGGFGSFECMHGWTLGHLNMNQWRCDRCCKVLLKILGVLPVQ